MARSKVNILLKGNADAGVIKKGERDRQLKLASKRWGPELEGLGWTRHSKPRRHFSRNVYLSPNKELSRSEKPALTEHLFRFPSAPIYGLNRKRGYDISFERWNMHSLRVLGRAGDNRPVGRLFLFHNGLNETENLRFYYRLANWIFEEDPGDKSKTRSACLIAPFPGHLMHAPFPGPFTQTPLSRYLSDSGELFRQFLRYMVEMRWLLAAINERRPEEWLIGDRVPDHEGLGGSILEEAEFLRAASKAALKSSESPKKNWTKEEERKELGSPVDQGEIESMIAVLKEVLNVGENREGEDRDGSSLPVHVVGYSLGGFLAQSVFFAWPNLVSSCSTICSGGAIRALSPTAFANPEEWQAVLHTLRPELEQSMLRGRISRRGKRIAGMDEAQFSYFQRIFDQVFLQVDKASYEARLAEYGTRMLFIGGGNDPIVRPKEILDASPEEGITMLTIANLTHFLDSDRGSDREINQREFWLPVAAGLIARAAGRAGDLREEECQTVQKTHEAIKAWEKSTTEGEKKQKAPRIGEPRERDLSSPTFEQALDWVIDGVRHQGSSSSGWLFVCRNILPAAFLGSDMHRAWATGLHHHDVDLQTYALDLTRHAAWLRDIKSRVTLLLPAGVEDSFINVASEMPDPHSDAPGYQLSASVRRKAWKRFVKDWGERVRWLAAGPLDKPLASKGEGGPYRRFARTFTRGETEEDVPPDYFEVAHLPDAWISFDVEEFIPGEKATEEYGAIWSFVSWVEMMLAREQIRISNEGGPDEARRATLENSPIGSFIRDGKVRVVRVSGSELNPRYRGKFEQSPSQVLQVLAQCAAALIRSTDKPKEPQERASS